MSTKSPNLTEESWHKVYEAFEAARVLQGRARIRQVEVICGHDSTLVGQVHRMLKQLEAGDDTWLRFLDESAAETHFAVSLAESCDDDNSILSEAARGERIGRYEIVRLIGSGGMGVVYEAVQDMPRRRVALKVMRTSMSTREASRRFRYEVEILGSLLHPNIAQIYDAGMHYEDGSPRDGSAGLPYFAMEFVAGASPIDEYVESHELALKERLRLFVDVCRAVHHGHQNRVIHRDLKPGNILVGSDGRVKVIDFGVAKATDSDRAKATQRTDIGRLVGTVHYMSPEQCQLEKGQSAIDLRSDVYSLGVVLYRVLCGRLPYETPGTSLISSARAVCDSEITSPSRVDRRLRGDIEAVMLKALERLPEKRYQSADALATDIQSLMKGEPVTARRIRYLDRPLTFVRRNPVPVVITTLLCLALMIVTTVLVNTWVVSSRPSHVAIDKSSLTAQLMSSDGTVIREWKGSWGAIMMHQVQSREDRDVVVVSYDTVEQNPLAGQIAFYESAVDSPAYAEIPMPTRGGWPEDWLRQLEGMPPEQDSFSVSQLFEADVFPEFPGSEVVVRYVHSPFFPTLIRVLDAQGNILWDRWHKGHIQIEWSESDHCFLGIGVRNDRLGERFEISDLALPKSEYPRICFAITPALTQARDDVIMRDSLPTEGVLWYKYVVPPQMWKQASRYHIEKRITQSGAQRTMFRFFPIDADRERRFVSFEVDPRTGRVNAVVTSNGFEEWPGDVKSEQLRLCAWPPTREELLGRYLDQQSRLAPVDDEN